MFSLWLRVDHIADENCLPLSVVTVAGTPNLVTHVVMKAFAHAVASMLRNGAASNHLVDMSNIVNR
jgi:hypothetical protein